MGCMEACRSIDLGHYAEWADSERLAINVDCLYKWGGEGLDVDVWTAMQQMGE